ncbi:hypothetical protein [Mesorhizobium sp.]|uniref:hypothetical protein n=1 Tax=Mesorhizobium sp. TaxID=1871066 RepID=UPI0025EBFDF2|nr:hypothetical protein [Mesorhizobium sp.]
MTANLHAINLFAPIRLIDHPAGKPEGFLFELAENIRVASWVGHFDTLAWKLLGKNINVRALFPCYPVPKIAFNWQTRTHFDWNAGDICQA